MSEEIKFNPETGEVYPAGDSGGETRRPFSVSNSTLSYLKRILNGTDGEPLPTFVFNYGKLVDALITEPDRVDHHRRMLKPNPVYPDDEPAYYSRAQFDLAVANCNTFFDDPFCRELWKLSEFQKKSRKEDHEFDFGGVKFKLDISCRWDLWMPSLNWGAEFKTTGAQTLNDFYKNCDLYDYDRAAYWYMNCTDTDQYMIIGVTKTTNKLYKIAVKRGDAFYNSGEQKALNLAFKYWMLFV